MSIIYLNGEFKEDNTPLISHRDCGFITAIGVFDSMLAVDSILTHPQEHYERLIHDSQTVIGLIPDLSFDQFKKICRDLLNKNSLQTGHARIRSTITGGDVDTPLAPAQKSTVLIDAGPSNPPPETLITCAIIPDFPRISGCVLENCKRLDYSRSYAARRKAESLGAEEAILINTDGNIACGATSNIFIEENGTMITPPLSDGVLAGVTRRKIIEERNALEDSISIDRLRSANKACLTNSFIGLREIQKII